MAAIISLIAELPIAYHAFAAHVAAHTTFLFELA